MEQFLRRNSVMVCLLAALLAMLVAGYVAIGKYYDGLLAAEKVELRAKIKERQFADKRREIEQSFKLMYESIRTISLFPGVRQISGGNRKSESEDVVKESRFPADAQQTVQQLYNNLASNVAVSEIYAVVDGFDRKKGEFPFFMYDSLTLNGGAADGGDKVKDPDAPEESEEAEYAYYPAQIVYFKTYFPKFTFTGLSELPAVLSPMMRTCDNAQYTSTAHGNVGDANGMLYSVPFYSQTTGELRGIISAIFRTNVLEARLVGVPFLLVTQADFQEARRLNFKMPTEFSTFVLFNDKYGVTIADRRNGDIVKQCDAG